MVHKPSVECWRIWHDVLNLVGRGNTRGWLPLLRSASQRFPESVSYPGGLFVGIYGWYTAPVDYQIRVFREIDEHAHRGEPWAMCKMGSAFYHGLQVPRDWGQAYLWFSRAAAFDQAEAQCRAAHLLRYWVQPRDMKGALELYLLVAPKRYSAWAEEARLACAEMYAFGLGVQEDPQLATYLIKPLLADQHNRSDDERRLIAQIGDRLGIPGTNR